jgi:hypothetical protein
LEGGSQDSRRKGTSRFGAEKTTSSWKERSFKATIEANGIVIAVIKGETGWRVVGVSATETERATTRITCHFSPGSEGLGTSARAVAALTVMTKG